MAELIDPPAPATRTFFPSANGRTPRGTPGDGTGERIYLAKYLPDCGSYRVCFIICSVKTSLLPQISDTVRQRAAYLVASAVSRSTSSLMRCQARSTW